MYLKMSKTDANVQADAIIQALDGFKGRIKKGRRSFIMLATVERISEEMKKEIKMEVEDATFRY